MTRPDLTSYHVVHAALRRAPHRLAAASRAVTPTDRRRVAALARYWKGYAAEVHGHHTIEDVVFFPALVEQVPDAARHLDRLGSEHHRLDALMTACGNAVDDLRRDRNRAAAVELAAWLDALAELMDGHLEYEDVEILPMFAEHFSQEEYDVLEQQAMKHTGVGPQAAFAVPFVVDAATPEQFATIFDTAPTPLRVLFRLTRGRHARLAARALGTAASDDSEQAGTAERELVASR
jgi:hemerythrin-like domain-containing protein